MPRSKLRESVVPTGEARSQLPAFLRRFRRRGARARPIVIGAHRKPEAVVIPYALYEQLIDYIDDLLIAREVRERLNRPREGMDLPAAAAELGIDVAELQEMESAGTG